MRDSAQCIDRNRRAKCDSREPHCAYRFACGPAHAVEHARKNYGVDAEPRRPEHGSRRVSRRSFDPEWMRRPRRSQERLRPVDSRRPDAERQLRIGRHQQYQPSSLAGVRKARAHENSISSAKMSVDDPEPRRQVCSDPVRMGDATRVGHQPRAGQGPPIASRGRLGKPGSGEKLAADRGLRF